MRIEPSVGETATGRGYERRRKKENPKFSLWRSEKPNDAGCHQSKPKRANQDPPTRLMACVCERGAATYKGFLNGYTSLDLNVFLAQHVRTSPQQKCFFHFTDRRNLASIQAHGILSLALCRSRQIDIPAPGGNQWSWDADRIRNLDQYVHLCFTANHPMEYICRSEGRIQDAAWLRIRPEVVLRPGVLMTADVANKAGVAANPPALALDELDLEVLYRRTDWRDAVMKQRLSKARKCEILVPDQIFNNDIIN